MVVKLNVHHVCGEISVRVTLREVIIGSGKLINVRAMGVGRITDCVTGGRAKRKSRKMKVIGWNTSRSSWNR